MSAEPGPGLLKTPASPMIPRCRNATGAGNRGEVAATVGQYSLDEIDKPEHRPRSREWEAMDVMLLALLWSVQVIQAAPTVDPAICAVDEAAHMSRPWSDFEFSTETPGSPMWLHARGCYRSAAMISRAYLAKGPPLSIREQAITQLHMARNLAYAGDEVAATQATASARRSDLRTDQETPLDWNSYVQGLYAFLVKDRTLLMENLDRLTSSSGDGNAINGRNLSALATCFDASYTQAMTDPQCWAAEPAAP